MPDLNEVALLEIEAPDAPPTLVDAARRHAGLIATDTRRRRTRRTASLGLSAVVVAGIAFTPPGQAATEWIADVAGIGDEPTLEHASAVPGSAVVFGTGTAPDGTPFEIVAERQSSETFNQRIRDLREDGGLVIADGAICPRIDFPTHRVSGGEFCWVIGTGAVPLGLNGMGFSLSMRDQSAPNPLWGEVGPDVARVRVIFAAPNEEPRDLEVTIAHLSGELQKQVGADRPFGVFVSFPPFEADSLSEIYVDGNQLKVIAYDEAGTEIDRRNLLLGPGAVPAHPPALRGDVQRIDEVAGSGR
jgi:hypothetical protein